MRGSWRDRLDAAVARVRRIERRELRDLRRWVERTDTLVHLSVLAIVPLLVAFVTALSNAIEQLSFLLFPPLAAGSYTLFADPEGKYSSPTRFVVGLTAGALCGWGALTASAAVGLADGVGPLSSGAFEAALAVFATGAVTWAVDVEEPSAYSTALLGLLVPVDQERAFVLSVFAASNIVAVVFYVWRERFYEQRAQILYESVEGDDRVLVPMRGENPDSTAMLAARLAGAHDAGKVVLLDLVADADAAALERDLLDDRPDGHRVATDGGDAADGAAGDEVEDARERAVAETARRLEARASDIETQVGVPCQVVVAAVGGGSPAATVRKAAVETNCDLIAAAYEEHDGGLSPFVRGLFRGRTDVIVHRSQTGRTRWRRVLVPVRGASDVAHGMLDFAVRLTGKTGLVSVATCVTGDRARRRGEEMLADLVAAFDGNFETRVSTQSIETYLAETAGDFDLVVIGASRERTAASRLISPPTFERIRDVDADVAVVDRN
jgi:nucleotide-binding universal stress UspA family protein